MSQDISVSLMCPHICDFLSSSLWDLKTQNCILKKDIYDEGSIPNENGSKGATQDGTDTYESLLEEKKNLTPLRHDAIIFRLTTRVFFQAEQHMLVYVRSTAYDIFFLSQYVYWLPDKRQACRYTGRIQTQEIAQSDSPELRSRGGSATLARW